MPDVFVSQPKVVVPTTEKAKSAVSGHSHGLLSTFSVYPDHVDFETRGEDEKIILLLRQHIIVNVKWILVAAVMFFVPTLAKGFGVFNTISGGLELIIIMAWYLVTMAYAFENFLSWYFNVYIVTNERIVDVNFHNLIYKSVSDATLDNIQDVTYNMGGVTRTVFNYGDVFIQTASEVSRFDFLAVPNPARVSKMINELTEQHEEGKNI